MLAAMAHLSFFDPERAAVHLEAATSEGPTEGFSRLYLGLRAYLAIACFATGDAGRAVELAREACAPLYGVSFDHARPASLVAVAATGDVESARNILRDYAESVRRSDFPYGAESVFILAAVLAALEDDWPTTSRLLSAGVGGFYRDPANSLLYYTYRDRARDVLGPERARVYRAEGRSMSRDDAWELALR
jgi:hypothetical protein